MDNRLKLIYNQEILDGQWDSSKNTIENVMSHNEILDYDVYDINDIKGDEPYCLIIKHIYPLSLYIQQNEKLPISDLSKLKNCKIIFLNDTESDYEDVVHRLESMISKYGLSPTQFYIVNNNSKLKDYKSTEINLHTNRRLAIWISHSMTFTRPKFKLNKDLFFTFHIRENKIHRFLLLCLFKKYDLIDETDWSLLRGWDTKRFIDDEGRMRLFFYDQIFDSEDVKYLSDEIKYFHGFDVKKSIYELDFEFDIKNPNYNHLFKLDTYSNAYINVVTESEFAKDVVHITEKSFLPFYFFQLPVFFASQHHLRILKETYGFDTYDDLIDHSYDNEPDDSKRFYMAFYELIRLHQNKDQVIEFYETNKTRIFKNSEIVFKIKDDMTDHNFYKSLI